MLMIARQEDIQLINLFLTICFYHSNTDNFFSVFFFLL